MKKLRLNHLLAISLLILVTPVSSNYSLRELDFGGGGGVGKSSQYSFEGLVSEQGTPMSGTTYNGGLGFGFTQMAFVPAAPTVSNPASYYDQLQIIVNTSGNPSDALYAIAISSDNFVTTQYVKSDQAIGSSLTITDYQSYAAWGGDSGFNVVGLLPSTNYQVKVKALHGNFTESGFGPSANASTVNATLTFDIDISATDTPTSPPYILSLGTLLAGTVTTATNKIWLTLDSNTGTGGTIYIVGQNGSLNSAATGYNITSTAANLAVASEGFGLRGDTIVQSSGGPFAFEPSFSLAADNVAAIPTSYTKLANTAGPVTNGRASLLVKAKPSSSAPAGSDYQELLTIIASAGF